MEHLETVSRFKSGIEYEQEAERCFKIKERRVIKKRGTRSTNFYEIMLIACPRTNTLAAL